MRNLVLFLFLFLLSLCLSAQIPGGLCNWDNNKKAAIVLTFDDWSPGHYPLVVPALSSRNINATFFVTLAQIPSAAEWTKVNTAATNGNEIANHTKTHPGLTASSGAQLKDEIRNMKSLIDANIPSQKALIFAYPFGASNATVIDSVRASGHIAGRAVSPGTYAYNFAPTNNSYYNISTFPMDNTVSIGAYTTQLQNVIAGGGLLTFLYHSIDNAAGTYGDNWFSKILNTDLGLQLDQVVAVKNTAWVTTFGQAIKYHKERSCATLTETQAPNGSTWKFNLTDTLNNTVFNQPLSIKLKLNGVNYTSVKQNGVAVAIDLQQNDSIMFHALPDGGPIVLATSSNIVITSATVTPASVSNNALAPVTFDVTATATSGSIASVVLNLTSIGGGAAVSMTSSGATTWTKNFSIASGFPIGTYSVPVLVTDNLANTLPTTISISVTAGTTISSAIVSPSSVFNNVVNPLVFSVTAIDDGFIASINLDLTSIGGGAAVAMSFVSGNNYTLNYSMPSGISTGVKLIPISVVDNLGNSTMQNISITVSSSTVYLDIYTDATTLVTGTWAANAPSTLTEQTGAGAIEGTKDYLFNYSISGFFAGLGLNISNWTDAQAKDFSSFQSIELSYNGASTPGTTINLTLKGPGGTTSVVKALPISGVYTTVVVPLSFFSPFDLTKITEIDFAIAGVASGIGTLRLDNIRLSKPAAVLPVSLLSFNANKLNSNIVIDWSTIDERDCANFKLQKSYDAKYYKDIYTISCKGVGLNKYTYIDAISTGETIYYRLIQIDLNGTETIYSPVVVQDKSADDLFGLYPNPIDGNGILNFNYSKKCSVVLFDIHGSVMISKVFENNSQLFLTLPNLPKGMYVYYAYSDEKIIKTGKLLVE